MTDQFAMASCDQVCRSPVRLQIGDYLRSQPETELAGGPGEESVNTLSDNDSAGSIAKVVRLSEVEPESVEFLWPGRIAKGKLNIIEGDPKTGKSTLVLDLVARVTTGSPMPDGAQLPGPAAVILMTAEDGLADTVRPRLDAAHADCSRVIAWEGVPIQGDDGNQISVRPPSLPNDRELLEELIVGHGAALVVIDVLNAYLGSNVDGHKDQDVRRALMPLAKIAERTGTAIVIVRHLNKSTGGNALYRGGGSIGIAGAARSILLAAVDPDDNAGDKRVLAVTACNVAAPVPALVYRIVSAEENGCARIVWDGVSEHTSGTLLSGTSDDEDRSARHEAVAFLQDYLSTGKHPAAEVKQAAKDAGIAVRTLERARKQANVLSLHEGFGPGSAYYWHLAGEHVRQETAMDAMDANNPGLASKASMAPMSDES